MPTAMFFGDIHGLIIQMYKKALRWEQENNKKVDMIFQLGDFEAIRCEEDIKNIKGPKRYRKLGEFQKYHSGELRAPILTCFLGGNHENYDFLDTRYPEGFEVAPNIFYLGRSGVKDFGEFKLGFLSGIESPKHFDKPKEINHKNLHSNRTRKIATYYNFEEVSKLGGEIVDILVSHLYPDNLFFDREPNQIDNLIRETKPDYFFAGHLHEHRHKEITIDDQLIKAEILAEIGQPNDYVVLEF